MASRAARASPYPAATWAIFSPAPASAPALATSSTSLHVAASFSAPKFALFDLRLCAAAEPAPQLSRRSGYSELTAKPLRAGYWAGSRFHLFHADIARLCEKAGYTLEGITIDMDDLNPLPVIQGDGSTVNVPNPQALSPIDDPAGNGDNWLNLNREADAPAPSPYENFYGSNHPEGGAEINITLPVSPSR